MPGLLNLSDFEVKKQPVELSALSKESFGDPTATLGLSLAEMQSAIGKLQKNQILHMVSKGSWSNHQLVQYLVDQFGPAHLLMTTWAMTEEPLRQLVELRDKGFILSAKCILSERISERTPGVMQFANTFFDELKLIRLHAKVTVLLGDHWGVAVVGSANFTRNPRVEAGVIDTHREIALFHADWITQELERKNEQ